MPCCHFFRIIVNAGIDKSKIVDIWMVDVRYLKVYNSHYGDSGPVGELCIRLNENVSKITIRNFW